jgi:putative protease
VARARQAGLRVTLATVRIQKPGEEGYDARLARLSPDGVLVRHWGALMAFAPGAGARDPHPGGPERPLVHGDFSLNVTNAVTALHLFGLGADTLTAAHDLDAEQVLALLEATPSGRIAVTVHHHIPTFHTEHCVYAHLLSQGRDHRTCGRPCESHAVGLADHLGLQHPVVVDVGCRNTVFNAQAQSAAFLVPALIERGVRRLRLEFVREEAADTARVLTAYAQLVDGDIGTAELRRRLGTHEQFGVTRGTMTLLGPRAP